MFKSKLASLFADPYGAPALVWRLLTEQGVAHWRRFLSPGDPELQLIQCAEYLPDPPAALNNSYTNAVQQNGTLSAARQAASATASEKP